MAKNFHHQDFLACLAPLHCIEKFPPPARPPMNHVPKKYIDPPPQRNLPLTRGSKTPVVSIHAFDFERVCHQLYRKGLSPVRLDDAGEVAESPLLASPLNKRHAVVQVSASKAAGLFLLLLWKGNRKDWFALDLAAILGQGIVLSWSRRRCPLHFSQEPGRASLLDRALGSPPATSCILHPQRFYCGAIAYIHRRQ